jgi:hypothetical protein
MFLSICQESALASPQVLLSAGLLYVTLATDIMYLHTPGRQTLTHTGMLEMLN